MAGFSVVLLLLLLLVLVSVSVSVRAWERVDPTELLSAYETGRWADSVTSPDDDSLDKGDEPIPEEALPVVEGAATSDLDADNGFQVEGGDFDTSMWDSSEDGGYPMEFVDPPPRGWPSSAGSGATGLHFVCRDNGFQIAVPTGQLSQVKIMGSKELLSVRDAPESCDYKVDYLTNTLAVSFSGCHVKRTNSYTLQLLYTDELGQMQVGSASCEANPAFAPSLSPRSIDQPRFKECNKPNPTPSKAQNCAVAKGEQVTCGQSGISSADCEKMGCCVDSSTSACYYPLDECTGDQNFVFAIRSDSGSIPLDPTKLVFPGSPNCKPVIVNDKVAIFKFKVTECGTRAYEVGGTKVYLAEVQTTVQALNLKYGAVTRSDPLRFMVECRYSKDGTAQQGLASIGYMVKLPTSNLQSSLVSQGLYAVLLRIAKDATYSSYLPTYHQPLRVLLGKPLYLELQLRSARSNAVILVNYCLAYPASATTALVLVYEGCANPFDTTVGILKVSDLPKNRSQRRFVVDAFQFMDQKTNQFLDEEIYFMCSTEVCIPGEKTCEDRCFDGKAP